MTANDDNLPLKSQRRGVPILLFSVCVAAACAIIYEIIIASISSYLLGNSVHHFSITIGLFMSSMGLGSFLSKYFVRRLIDRFILIEVAIGLLGGISTVLLFWMYVYSGSDIGYFAVMFALIVGIGTLVGLEIPILTRIMKQYGSLRMTLANVLAFDYIGALVGSIAFPLFLLKHLGLVQTAFVVGFLNVLVAMAVLFQYWRDVAKRFILTVFASLVGLALLIASVRGASISERLEADIYNNQIVLSTQSKYQKIVLTRMGNAWWSDEPRTNKQQKAIIAKRSNDLRLFIDGQLQFSSVDEYRYHEALVHPAMSVANKRDAVLILGGGDGLAAREVLKYSDVQRIILVDIDPEITRICSTNPEIVALNQGSLTHPKVVIINQDAYKFVEKTDEVFDVIIIDLPDPNHESLSKLYAVEFYRLTARVLCPGGSLVTQSTSPFFARAAFWCIHHSIEAAGLHTVAYHLEVPSMGDWGFNLASNRPIDVKNIPLRVETLYLTQSYLPAMFGFGKDVAEIETSINTLLRPILMDYYNDKRWTYY
ncbi:TPA: polyamine aminopropyltransferase [Candidatus Poribacteria bacterium]|nr:polyamine aminopropyltransferase [Candidatus Poribacteria bacterium]